MPMQYKKWIANFISGRQAHVTYGGRKSKTRMFSNGVPQGAVLSPSLFNLFLSDLPSPTVPGISVSSYADDLTIVSQHSIVNTAAQNLQHYIHQLEQWLTSNRMSVSAPKSSLTLITPHTGEYRLTPMVKLFGTPIPVNPTTKILGITIDRGMSFRPHVSEVNARAKSRLNVMRALSSSKFGHSCESQTALYKQFIRPVLEYASPAWSPNLAQSHMATLQRTQNSALRIATGCVRSTPVAHLHSETRVLPLKEHTNMRGLQFFAAASNPEHPCNHLHHPEPTSRNLRTTPSSHFSGLQDALLPTPPGRTQSSWIHEQSVSQYLESAPGNNLLEAPPPSANQEELSLPRQDRVHLSRLRCGHHPAIPSYEHRLRPDTNPTCRWCQGPAETVTHLFEDCPALGGTRGLRGITTVGDLWTSPAASLGFLRDAGVLQPHKKLTHG